MKRAKLGLVLLGCILLVGLSSCAARKNGSVDEAYDLAADSALRRPANPGAKIVEIPVSRTDLNRRLALGSSINKARVVEVFSRDGRAGLPEYRLFDVQKESALALLGLESADVLLSAEEIAFSSPDKFSGYVSLLPELKQGQIEIRRSGAPIILRYKLN